MGNDRKIQAAAILFLLIGTTAAVQPRRIEELSSVWVAPKTGMELILLDTGSFIMGSPSIEPMREAQETAHPVTLTRSFWLGRYEVTQAEWRRVMGSTPSHFSDCGPDCPVENISGYEVSEFLDKLSVQILQLLELPEESKAPTSGEVRLLTAHPGTPTASLLARTRSATYRRVPGSSSGLLRSW